MIEGMYIENVIAGELQVVHLVMVVLKNGEYSNNIKIGVDN